MSYNVQVKGKVYDSNSDDHVATTMRAYTQIHNEYANNNRLLNDDIKQSIDEFLGHVSGKEVLDIGCAGGRETGYIAEKGFVASGCDLSPEFIATAQKTHPNCTFFVADMRHLGDRPERYNGLWCNAAFLHVPKKDALVTLQGFHKLLQPKGMLYLSVMQGSFDDLRENKQMNWPDRHFSDYTQDELDDLLHTAGFEKINSRSTVTNWGPVFLHEFYRKVEARENMA